MRLLESIDARDEGEEEHEIQHHVDGPVLIQCADGEVIEERVEESEDGADGIVDSHDGIARLSIVARNQGIKHGEIVDPVCTKDDVTDVLNLTGDDGDESGDDGGDDLHDEERKKKFWTIKRRSIVSTDVVPHLTEDHHR